MSKDSALRRMLSEFAFMSSVIHIPAFNPSGQSENHLIIRLIRILGILFIIHESSKCMKDK